MPLESWCRLQFVHSGRESRLSLNGREVARVAGTLNWPGPLPFTVGGQGFGGLVDEIRLGLVIPRNEYMLPAECAFSFPENVQVPKEGDVVIAFDSEGRLDMPEEFRFTIRSSEASTEIRIGPSGTLQR